MAFSQQLQRRSQQALRTLEKRRSGTHTVSRQNRMVTRYTSDESAGVTLASYMVLGLSNCYEKNDEGKLTDRLVIEPLSAPALECMAAGARTSFRHVTGVTVETAMSKDKSLLPEEFDGGIFCDKYEYRCDAAARTWQRTHAQDNLMDLVPLGAVRSNFNFDLTDKRVLNFENVVTDADNIRQDISIDVYGRKTDEEAAAAPDSTACETMQQQEEDDGLDELDSLLTA